MWYNSNHIHIYFVACSDYAGIVNPTNFYKCCASTCGEFCGAQNCDQGPGGNQACCSGFYDLKICGVSGEMAPCIIQHTGNI